MSQETGLRADDGQQAWTRANQDDPFVLHIVLQKSALKDTPVATLCADVVAASLAAADAWGDSERFIEWEAESFRKVCLHARPAQWDSMEDFVQAGSVRIVAPVRRSERQPVLAKMQAVNTAAATLPMDTAAVEPSDRVLLVLPDSWPTSVGKALAQLSHAALLWHRLWAPGTRDFAVCLADEAAWPRLVSEHEVRDAGLTEVAPGTATVRSIEARATIPAGVSLLV